MENYDGCNNPSGLNTYNIQKKMGEEFFCMADLSIPLTTELRSWKIFALLSSSDNWNITASN